MTNPEYTEASPERHLPQWEAFDKHVRERIECTSSVLEIADDIVAAHETASLNKLLKSEGLLGIPMQVQTSLPTFLEYTLTENGVTETPLISAELMKKTAFTGTFKGCVVMGLQAEPTNLLFYEVELSKSDESKVVLRAPVEDSKVKVEYPDLDDWDEEARGAFAVLETVEDEDYQSAVEGLAEAFWNTDQPLVIRLRTIGIHACELLAHETHLESQELQAALGTILLCSLDEDLAYRVKGVYVDESGERDGVPVIKAAYSERDRIMRPVGVRYVTNFDVITANEKVVDAQVGTTMQPAFTFFDTKARVELDYPMRFLALIEEHEHDTDATRLDTVRQLGSASINRAATMENGKTCGEWTREYSQKYADGV